MLVPTNTSAPSNVASDLRKRRDLFFDSAAAIFGFQGPLTPETAGNWGIGEGSRYAGSPEIAEVPLRSIVIGTFTRSRSVLSASGQAIYTEIILHVSDVFEDTAGRITTNSDITLAFLGGTVKTGDGKVISFLANPKKYYLQPQRTYLLALKYQPAPELYTVASNWDFTSGVVKANSSIDRGLEMSGGSAILGLTKEQLATYLRRYLKH